jgi:excisionase family DNA binding protein
MEITQLEQRLRNIETLLLTQKTVLNFDEAASYTGLSKSYLYKLTSAAQIPHFKPQGKHIYFSKAEVDAWLQRSPVTPVNEADIEEQAATYTTITRKGGARC